MPGFLFTSAEPCEVIQATACQRLATSVAGQHGVYRAIEFEVIGSDLDEHAALQVPVDQSAPAHRHPFARGSRLEQVYIVVEKLELGP